MRQGRLPWLRRDELDAVQIELYDKITSGVRMRTARLTPLTDDEGRLHGPFNALLSNPGIGDPVQALGAALRFAGTLAPDLFEALVLLVASARSADYEWYAHAPIASRNGMTDRQLDAIRSGRWEAAGAPLSADIVRLARATLAHQTPALTLIRRLERSLGVGGVTEIVIVLGYYDLIATTMRTWDVPVPGQP